MYPLHRNLHLLFGVLSLPFLLLYGVSAVQMAHSKWFAMKPSVSERRIQLRAGYDSSRAIAQELMHRHGLRGELNSVRATPDAFSLRIVVPGTVHEARYEIATGTTTVKTSIAGFLGMINRLHHAAGFWPAYVPLKLWGGAVALVSLAVLGLGVTGLYMWWKRRQERAAGLVLIGANLLFSLVVLVWLRLSS